MIVPASRLLWLVGLIVCPALTLAGIRPEATPACLAASALLAVVALLDWLRSRDQLASLSVQLPPIVRLVKARPGFLPVTFRHQGTSPLPVRIALGLPQGIESSMPDWSTTLPEAPSSRFDWPVRAPQRGRFQVRACHFETRSGLGLWQLRHSVPVQAEVRVQPDLASGLHANAAFLAQALTGSRSLRQVGKGRDFEKLREYINGDPVEDIHWRATAKRGHPVTKIFQVERTQEVYVLVDASRLSGRVLASDPATPAGTPPDPLLEQFIQAALILGSVTERQGDLFGLVTFASQVGSFVRADNGNSHFSACREQLVTLQAQAVTPDFEELASFVRVRLRRRALLLFLTSLDDPVAAEGFLRGIDVLRRQHLCVVVQPRGPAVVPIFSTDQVNHVDDIHKALAGHLQWRGLRELQSVLQHRGVTLAMAPAESLAATLVTRYLDVKRRQAL